MNGPLLTTWSIRGALICYVVVLAAWIVAGRGGRGDRLWRSMSTVGCALLLLHMACAFHFYHGWSHVRAMQHTAAVTERVVGLRFGGGIYFNYAFAAVWLGEVAWWWVNRESYASRPRVLHYAIQTYLIFIALNGAVIFAAGPARWAGVAMCCGLAAIFIGKKFSTRWRNRS